MFFLSFFLFFVLCSGSQQQKRIWGVGNGGEIAEDGGVSTGWLMRHRCNSSSTTRGDNLLTQQDLSSTISYLVSATDAHSGLPVVFFLGADGNVWSLWKISQREGWSDFVKVGKPENETLSSIAVAPDGKGTLNVFGLNGDGLVFRSLQARPTRHSPIAGCSSESPSSIPCMEFSMFQVLNNRFSSGASDLSAQLNGDGRISLFAVVQSLPYQMEEVAATAGLYSPVQAVPTKHQLDSSFTVIRNDNTGFFEAFARLSNSKNLQRTWQTSSGTWSDKWDEPGSFPPNCDSNPVALAKTADGLLEIYLRESDQLHWAHESSCKNSGSCDWSSWSELPKHDHSSSVQSFAVTNNIGGGTDVILTGDDGNLYRVYQETHRGKWESWESLGNPDNLLHTQPVAVQSGVGTYDVVVPRVDGSLALYSGPATISAPTQISVGGDLQVSWSVSSDIAAKTDQINVYQISERDPDNWRLSLYVGGSTSSGKDPVPSGSLTFSKVSLPEGTYEVRYMAFAGDGMVTVASQPFQLSDSVATNAVYSLSGGLIQSLGIYGVDTFLCAKNWSTSYEDFNYGFGNYSVGNTILGLNYLGQALQQFSDSLTKCGEDQVATAVSGFAMDMILCNSTIECDSFDISDPQYVIFDGRHDINSDLLISSTNWKVGEYVQCGQTFGSAISACIYSPSSP